MGSSPIGALREKMKAIVSLFKENKTFFITYYTFVLILFVVFFTHFLPLMGDFID